MHHGGATSLWVVCGSCPSDGGEVGMERGGRALGDGREVGPDRADGGTALPPCAQLRP